MTVFSLRMATLAVVGLALAPPTWADSFASSASSAGSASSGSVSDSLEGSSNSSSRDRDVAEGDYRVIEVADVIDRPGMLRVTMQPARDESRGSEVLLVVPERTLAQRAVRRGEVVRASHRPYGLEFAHADTREAFFLVLRDDWQRELDPRLVAL
jgi:hypothetical protein